MSLILRTLLACSLLALGSTSALGQDLFELEERAMRAAADAVAPAVVRIETIGGLERVGKVLVSEGPTTGLIVSADGYILSSAFNFLGQPTTILVTLNDGSRTAATIVARDHSRMLVLLKVEVEKALPVATATPLEEVTVGSWAIALGRSHEGDGVSISAGIVSAKGRIWDKAVQTDAKVSPNNYGGPLIDIQGRVLGVLTPMSPRGSGEAAAGAEWYDSGIGFAAPLAHVLPQLDRMKQGEDLHPGILGVSLKGRDVYNDPAILANVRPNSPASEAGLKVDDKIIEAEGKPIGRQAHLKHVLGGKYAGEKVALVVERGKERIEAEIELVKGLDPYVHPFLGILPTRSEVNEGVTIRYVFKNSAAGNAKLEVGDIVTKIAGKQITSVDDALECINGLKPNEEIELEYTRNEKQLTAKLTPGELSAEIPEELLPLEQPVAEPANELAGVSEIKLPEETSTSFVYAPKSYSPEESYALLVWLQAPGAFEEKALLAQWQSICDERGIILLAPHPANSARWLPTEVDFVANSIAAAQDRYSIDSNRIVVFGREGGGSMAYLMAFSKRELVRGVAAVDSAVPVRGAPPETEPTMRLSIFAATPADSKLVERIEPVMKVLRNKKFPVTTLELAAGADRISGKPKETLVRWLDSLDRL